MFRYRTSILNVIAVAAVTALFALGQLNGQQPPASNAVSDKVNNFVKAAATGDLDAVDLVMEKAQHLALKFRNDHRASQPGQAAIGAAQIPI